MHERPRRLDHDILPLVVCLRGEHKGERLARPRRRDIDDIVDGRVKDVAEDLPLVGAQTVTAARRDDRGDEGRVEEGRVEEARGDCPRGLVWCPVVLHAGRGGPVAAGRVPAGPRTPLPVPLVVPHVLVILFAAAVARRTASLAACSAEEAVEGGTEQHGLVELGALVELDSVEVPPGKGGVACLPLHHIGEGFRLGVVAIVVVVPIYPDASDVTPSCRARVSRKRRPKPIRRWRIFCRLTGAPRYRDERLQSSLVTMPVARGRGGPRRCVLRRKPFGAGTRAPAGPRRAASIELRKGSTTAIQKTVAQDSRYDMSRQIGRVFAAVRHPFLL